MILLYGIPGDGPLELIADTLEAKGMDFFLVNPRQFKLLDFIFFYDGKHFGGEISIGADSYPLDKITGIYNRGFDFELVPEAKDLFETDTFSMYQKMFNLFNQWIEVSEARVINRASAMASNASKPYQLSLIKSFFKIPDSLVTNSIRSLNSFREKYREIIYKSSSSIRSVVKSIEHGDTGMDFHSIRNCATLFQERLVGTNYRVHVIDKKLFAIKAEAETVDYRYSSREGKETILEEIKLPASISKKCLALANALGLAFAGIDLFLTDNSEWYCFEVNPSPGFSYFENNTGVPIADAVVEYLAGVKS
ncbi:hypothetical protein [Pollutibacter soli]|uniref:ATP-grasp domain-containing protein n=1 Tax=Pollutibacter soli TaxID=3034157 RepID=UPI003013FA04